jgi:hypothetical protein
MRHLILIFRNEMKDYSSDSCNVRVNAAYTFYAFHGASGFLSSRHQQLLAGTDEGRARG